MSVRIQIYESVWSDRWCLAGSITTSAPLTPAGHSLTLIRAFDSLSPAIRSAMTAKSIIPVVEINTPSGMVTLLNAKIENISPAATKGKIASGPSKGWIQAFSWEMTHASPSPGSGHVGGGGAGKVNVHDIKVAKSRPEEINFSFQELLTGHHHRRH